MVGLGVPGVSWIAGIFWPEIAGISSFLAKFSQIIPRKHACFGSFVLTKKHPVTTTQQGDQLALIGEKGSPSK